MTLKKSFAQQTPMDKQVLPNLSLLAGIATTLWTVSSNWSWSLAVYCIRFLVTVVYTKVSDKKCTKVANTCAKSKTCGNDGPTVCGRLNGKGIAYSTAVFANRCQFDIYNCNHQARGIITCFKVLEYIYFIIASLFQRTLLPPD